MPEPTNTPSAPSCMQREASAGVAIPPAVNGTTGRRPFSATHFTSSDRARGFGASARWRMGHWAIRGIVTASGMPLIMAGSDMRATPPPRRMSAGTRSRAITAHAPASSAIFACSASTTSMITPPLSISARPLLTRIVPYSAIGVSVARSDLIEERLMEPWSREPVGRFDELEIESAVLRDNPLGDPHVRPLWVYVPPAYDAEPDRRFP